MRWNRETNSCLGFVIYALVRPSQIRSSTPDIKDGSFSILWLIKRLTVKITGSCKYPCISLVIVKHQYLIMVHVQHAMNNMYPHTIVLYTSNNAQSINLQKRPLTYTDIRKIPEEAHKPPVRITFCGIRTSLSRRFNLNTERPPPCIEITYCM